MIDGSVAYVLCRVEDDCSLTLVRKHEDLSAGIKAGKRIVEIEDHAFSYALFTADLVARVARFAEVRAGYREWAHRRSYIHSLDDRYDHDVDEPIT